MQLLATVEEYLLENPVSRDYANQLRYRVKHFSTFAGDPSIEDIDRRKVNQWLAALVESDLAPKTAKGYRSALMAVWRWAYESGLTEQRPERIRRVIVPRTTPVAWTLDEVRLLLMVTEDMRLVVCGTNIPRSIWWTAFVHVAYCTALRLGDLLDLRWSDVRGECICVTQNKTGSPVMVPLSKAAIAALVALPRESEYILPWPGARSGFYSTFGTIVRKARVRQGTSKWLRRTAASYVELNFPGHASRYLGHASAALAAKHYLDPSICNSQPVRPPEL